MAVNNTTTLQGLNPVLTTMAWYLFSVIQFFGMFGNALTIFVLYRERCFKTNYYFLVFHLAVCDLVLLTSLVFSTAIQAVNIIPPPLYFLCGALPLFTGYIGSCEAYLLISIAVLRYRAIVYPFRMPFNRTKMNFIVLAVHTMSIVVLTPMAYFIVRGEAANLCSTASAKKYSLPYIIYEDITYVLFLVVPMALLMFLYPTIRHRQLIAQTTSSHDIVTTRLANAKQARNRKLVMSSVVVVTLFAIGMFPISVARLLLSHAIKVNPLHFYWSTLVYMLCTCAINPLVYGFSDKTLRSAYK